MASIEPPVDYVIEAARLLGLPLHAGQAERVAAHLARSAALAELLHAVPLDADAEPAELYRPAPFPAGDPS